MVNKSNVIRYSSVIHVYWCEFCSFKSLAIYSAFRCMSWPPGFVFIPCACSFIHNNGKVYARSCVVNVSGCSIDDIVGVLR